MNDGKGGEEVTWKVLISKIVKKVILVDTETIFQSFLLV